jgi:hypothetical protein
MFIQSRWGYGYRVKQSTGCSISGQISRQSLRNPL